MGGWLEVSIPTTVEGLEAVCACLTMLDVGGFAVEDGKEFHDHVERNQMYWDEVDAALVKRMEHAARVILYVTDDQDGYGVLERVKRELNALKARLPAVDFGALEPGTIPLRSDDWETNWKQYYKPFPVGSLLYVVPEWEESARIPPGRIPVRLNPGLLFGTGSHASTALCLELLETGMKPGATVLDIGCGSGILAIAALRLGAKRALACDIDPKAARIVMENAGFNGLRQAALTVKTGDILRDMELQQAVAAQTYDLILANIVADVILPLIERARPWLTPGGLFLCSGIIETRALEVETALRQHGFVPAEKKMRDAWCAYLAKKV